MRTAASTLHLLKETIRRAYPGALVIEKGKKNGGDYWISMDGMLGPLESGRTLYSALKHFNEQWDADLLKVGSTGRDKRHE